MIQNCKGATFRALFVTQFLGAFNDNFFKVLISLLVVGSGISPESQAKYLSLAGAMLVLPYVLFSSYAGFLSDKFSKSKVMQLTKFMEVIVMCVAAYFVIATNITALFIVLFFMGLQSALFSPGKYGILPEILDEDSLSKGNGYLQFGTFVAIIAGTALSGEILSRSDKGYIAPAVILVLVALFGLVASLFMKRSPPARSNAKLHLSPFHDIWHSFKAIWKDREISLTVMAISYFWFLGALFQLNIFLYAGEIGIESESAKSYLIAALGVGIGLGSILAGKVSEGKVELGLVPIGTVGMGLFAILLGFFQAPLWWVYFGMFVIGLSGGFYIVPLNAFLQKASPAKERGAYIAAGNFLSMAGVIAASLVLSIFSGYFGYRSSTLFIFAGILTLFVTVYILTVLPEVFLRCINWTLTHTIYRVTVEGIENIPKGRGGLIVSNHVSFIDASLLLASLDRPVRFLMYRPIYEMPLINFLAKRIKAIPIDGKDGKDAVIRSLQYARELIDQGELVGIFAEGGITRTGEMLPFKNGFESIMKGSSDPILPTYIDRMWGSIFSFSDNKAFWKIPKKIPYQVTIRFGQQMAASSLALEVEEVVREIGKSISSSGHIK